jgi:hypothetical protein
MASSVLILVVALFAALCSAQIPQLRVVTGSIDNPPAYAGRNFSWNYQISCTNPPCGLAITTVTFPTYINVYSWSVIPAPYNANNCTVLSNVMNCHWGNITTSSAITLQLFSTLKPSAPDGNDTLSVGVGNFTGLAAQLANQGNNPTNAADEIVPVIRLVDVATVGSLTVTCTNSRSTGDCVAGKPYDATKCNACRPERYSVILRYQQRSR